jgi:hypothetical protein
VFSIKSWPQKGKWTWYVGPGAGLRFAFGNKIDVPINLAIGGQIGVEYQIWFPLNLSLDYRPMINILGFQNIGVNPYGFALGIRYRFQKN